MSVFDHLEFDNHESLHYFNDCLLYTSDAADDYLTV